MRALTVREKLLLGACFAVIFLVANGFAARAIMKTLRGSGDRIRTLESELADYEMWLEEAPKADARLRWLEETLPNLKETTLGKAQGDLLQSLQDDVLDRKLKIEQQSLQDIVNDTFYTEVAVRLTVRGNEDEVIEWLISLQGREKFQVIKALELELDTRSKEEEPQAVCQITVARWFAPQGDATMTEQSRGQSTESKG
ncbi:MAG: hypothetical protein CMO55_10745 [Verrucomicrobiales bacterium]|nr:hypothetical protein [Verrucomicrobiales bacterium]